VQATAELKNSVFLQLIVIPFSEVIHGTSLYIVHLMPLFIYPAIAATIAWEWDCIYSGATVPMFYTATFKIFVDY